MISIGSGIFRIEGVTYDTKKKILPYLNPLKKEIDISVNIIKTLDSTFKYSYPNVAGSYKDIINYRAELARVRELKANLDKEIKQKLEQNFITSISKDILISVSNNLSYAILDDIDNKLLVEAASKLHDQSKTDNIILISKREDSINYVVSSLINKAGDIIKLLNNISLGRGGGRPNLAQGGTKEVSKLDLIINEIKVNINDLLRS
jgi:alanyl-tRNA synthetase